jgi:hypothetical protein
VSDECKTYFEAVKKAKQHRLASFYSTALQYRQFEICSVPVPGTGPVPYRLHLVLTHFYTVLTFFMRFQDDDLPP